MKARKMSNFEIVTREDFSDVTYLLEVHHPLMAKAAKPGQFVIVMLSENGERIPLTIADLPPEGTQRWVIRRKAEVVAAVRGGLLSLEEACKRYTLTVEEFLSWQQSIDKHGLAGLRATRVQQYRP